MSLWGRPRARGGQGQGAGPPLTLSVLLVTRGPCPPPVPPLPHVLGPDSRGLPVCHWKDFESLLSALLYLCFSVLGLWGSVCVLLPGASLLLSPPLLLLAPPPLSTGPSPSFYWPPSTNRGRLAAPCRQILMTWGGSHFPLTWGQLGR